MCNGFSDECELLGKYECNCQYNAEGPQCNRCKEGYKQKKWRKRTEFNKFECERKLFKYYIFIVLPKYHNYKIIVEVLERLIGSSF